MGDSKGETNLSVLLENMQPQLHEPVYVFASVADATALPHVQPIMSFREAEGQTLILTRAEAETHGLQVAFPCRMITLNVVSSLDAVGFLAAITAKLAAVGMGVNPVSAFFHDHLFVPAERADEAIELLQSLAVEVR